MRAYFNGEFIDERQAAVSIDDPGLLTGDGVFETARLHRGRYFRLDRHLARLEASAALLRLELPHRAALANVAERLVELNQLREASLRLTVTRGARSAGPTVFATLRPIAAENLARAERGWTLVTAETRRPPTSSLPAALKALGRTYSVLARLEAREAGADDALMLSVDGYIAEGPTWNLFWRRGRTLFTAALEVGVLEGVTRAAVLELARASGFTVEQVIRKREDLDTAEELFATMSSVGMVPIRSLDGRELESEAAARLLNARYWDLVGRECRPEGP